MINEEEEEKEVDPSLVGSLDNVYTEAPGTMPGEDPFKRVPMMQGKEKPSNLMEMEKTLDAMEASIDHESSQELDSSDDMSSLDMKGVTRRPRAEQMMVNDSLNRLHAQSDMERSHTDSAEFEHRALNQRQGLSEETEGGEGGAAVGGGSILPDLLTSGPATPPDIQLSSQPAPDVTAHPRNPLSPNLTGVSSRASSEAHRAEGGIRGNREQAVDLLHSTGTAPSLVSSTVSPAPPTNTQPLDLTDGLLGLRVGSQDVET